MPERKEMPDMLSDYQDFVRDFAIHPDSQTFMSMPGLTYSVLGLNGEAGECAEIIKKALRAEQPLSPAQRTNLMLELGDVLWYVTNTARLCGVSLSLLMEMNIEKLSARRAASSLAKTD